MPLQAGTQLGPYQIVSPLGAGGMGEVYRAVDSRLKRQVALKILPASLASDPERLARFQREAEVLASLNHPHIAAIYGLEDANGMKALVMELVDGHTLADRIHRGPIAIDEALPIAAQIAEALEAAHESGIIHRDLKPANIKVRDDGTVKVLDFGLAKLTETDPAGRAGMSSGGFDAPTMTSPAQMTGMGTILGTAAYMSPEQARGRSVNKRTDIWAFGAVLYEMLTGRRAFEGDGIADTIASVMKTTPDWSALPPEVPPAVVTLIQQCLEKDRNARIGDIAVARFLLSSRAAFAGSSHAGAPQSGQARTGSGSTQTGATQTGATRAGSTHAGPTGAAGSSGTSGVHGAQASDATSRAAAWAVGQLLGPEAATQLRSFRFSTSLALATMLGGVLVAGLVIWLWLAGGHATNAAALVTHLQMSVVPADRLVGGAASPRPGRTAFAISPDGRLVVFSGVKGDAVHLYQRPLDRVDATPVPGTEGGIGPFFSPDGAWVAFWADDKIKKVPVGGGPAATICDAPAGHGVRGASWATDGTIFFANDAGVSKVSAAGGAPVVIIKAESLNGLLAMLPSALPGGRALLLTLAPFQNWDAAQIVVQPVDGGERRVLIQGGADARYVATGHLVYMKNGTLMAVPFDAGSQKVTGAPIALIDGVAQAVNAANTDDESGAGQFAISAAGTLVYVPGGPFSMLQDTFDWVDRSGNATPLAATPPAPYLAPQLSPDGQRLVVAIRRTTPRGSDVWVYDITRGAPTRLTFNSGAFHGGGFPLWSPDGKRIAFIGAGAQGDGIYITNADGSGTPERLGEGGTLSSWSGAAHAIAFGRTTPDGAHGLWVLPLDGDRKPRLFLESRFDLYFPTFSPDGHWIAYISNESGAFELYVQPYPGPGEKIRVSTAGAFEPLWPAKGNEILYRIFNNGVLNIYSVPIRSLTPFRVDTPRLLFGSKLGVYDSTVPERAWDIDPNGQRFLMARFAGTADKPVTTMNVVLNWAEELKRLVPAK